MGSTNTGSTNGSAKKRQEQKATTAIVSARNLVAAVMASARAKFGTAGERLFGVSNPLQGSFTGEAVIEAGDIGRFLKGVAERFGVSELAIPATTNLNEAIADIARQLAERTRMMADLNDEQRIRIAIEYVTQACCISTTAIEPFTTYLPRAKRFRAAVKALNAAERASNPNAFSDGNDERTIERLLDQGRAAWASANQYLAESAHLRALRTMIHAPVLFTGLDAWRAVQAIGSATRVAALDELRAIIAQRGTPFVDMATVQLAAARVAGNAFLTGGNVFGVSVDTALEAISASRTAGIQPNGGTLVGFDGTPASAVGATLAGLKGHVHGKVERRDGRTVRFDLEVVEGPSPMAPFVTPLPVAGAYGTRTTIAA